MVTDSDSLTGLGIWTVPVTGFVTDA